MVRRLRIRDFVPAGQHCHFARSEIGPRDDPGLHRHDFHEVFWIERGRGWHTPGGRRAPLEAGDLVLVAPDDAHGFTADRGGRFRLANLAFASAHWEGLRRRYRPGRPDPFAGPRRFRLGRGDLAWLGGCCDGLAAGDRSRAALDRLLLNLLHLLDRLGAAEPRDAAAPAWLGAAVAGLAEPARFRAGPAALVSHAGLSHEHVARAVRRHYGTTPTILVNRARMAWAARQLAESDATPLDVCLACGLENLGHFYRLFRAAHGASPEAWRRRQREVLGG
jgi:AraC family cel operon transcriptional repressor